MFRQLGKIRKEDAESITQPGGIVVVVVVAVVVVAITDLLVSIVVESVWFEGCSG